MAQRGGANAWLFYNLQTPDALPYRLDKLINGEWRVMGWYGYRDELDRIAHDGIGSASKAAEAFGGVCRIVECDAMAFRNEWRAVA